MKPRSWKAWVVLQRGKFVCAEPTKSAALEYCGFPDTKFISVLITEIPKWKKAKKR